MTAASIRSFAAHLLLEDPREEACEKRYAGSGVEGRLGDHGRPAGHCSLGGYQTAHARRPCAGEPSLRPRPPAENEEQVAEIERMLASASQTRQGRVTDRIGTAKSDYRPSADPCHEAVAPSR